MPKDHDRKTNALRELDASGVLYLFERIAFSGGRLGCQVEMAPDDLARIVPLVRADLTVV